MVPLMIKVFLSLALVFSGIQVAVADQCQENACITVYTDNNQIIIEARKGNTTVKKTIAQAPKRVVVKTTPKPKAVPLFFPPAAKPVIKKPTVKRTYKPRIKKAVTKVNLSDRLTKLVPTAGVAYQPEFEPLSKCCRCISGVTYPQFFRAESTSSVKLWTSHFVPRLSGVLGTAVFMPLPKTGHRIRPAPSTTPISSQVSIKFHCSQPGMAPTHITQQRAQ